MPRYRIVFGRWPRTPWRATAAEAMQDAIEVGLASYDGAAREHFLSAPVDMETDRSDDGGLIAPPPLV